VHRGVCGVSRACPREREGEGERVRRRWRREEKKTESSEKRSSFCSRESVENRRGGAP
jgi:hypothetical protein